MIPLSPIRSGSQQEGDKSDGFGFELRGDRCYRFIAVGDSGVDDLDAAILDANDNVLLKDVYEDAAPILGPDDAFCPPVAGFYNYIVAVVKGGGGYHFQAWEGPRR